MYNQLIISINKTLKGSPMNYELTGTVKIIQDPQTFASGFTKRELIVTVPDGNYPQDISLEFLKDKADLLNELSVGDEVTVSFNLRGREYNGKYYNNLTGWKLQKNNGQSAQPSQSYPPQTSTPPNQVSEPNFDDDMDDIPF